MSKYTGELRVGDHVFSKFFNSNLEITKIVSDELWYFKICKGGRENIFKAKTPLSKFKKVSKVVYTPEPMNIHTERELLRASADYQLAYFKLTWKAFWASITFAFTKDTSRLVYAKRLREERSLLYDQPELFIN